ADASSARPRNAPPIPSDRAPGLPKLKVKPESDSMSVFCAAAGNVIAALRARNRQNLRMLKNSSWRHPERSEGSRMQRSERSFAVFAAQDDECARALVTSAITRAMTSA